jgi:heme-degrading monooxygenase HmoA
MIVTVFRSRLREENREAYAAVANRMSELARTMPGYVSHKSFTADDGERVTIVEFESEVAQREWARHAEHVAAKQQGREAFYTEYSLQICGVMRESRFPAPSSSGTIS